MGRSVSAGRGRWSETVTLYLLLLVLGSYVGVDLLVKRKAVGGCGRVEDLHGSVKADEEEDLCKRIDGHYDLSLSWSTRSKENEDPWKQLKWVGEPAYCRVRGQLIEKIDDENNFRRGFALKHAKDVEDRTHILPWLYGSRVDLNANARRVYLDLGANLFSSSIQWFTQIYPCDFTEMHAFERDKRLFHVPTVGFVEGSNYAPPNGESIRLKQKAEFPTWMLQRIHVYYKFVADADDDAVGAINITRFIKEELKLTAHDTVVVKMDIEGAEWPILERWMQDPEMIAIVDELFVEIHYDDRSMWNYHWARFAPKRRIDAKRLLAQLRWKGIFAHFWP